MAVQITEARIITIAGANEKEVAKEANKVATEERYKNPGALVTVKEGYYNIGGGCLFPEYKVIIVV